MELYQVAFACHVYGSFTGFDSALEDLRNATGPYPDLMNPAHRKAILVWLNKWGCRQFVVAYHKMASRALREWGEHHLLRLPRPGVPLTGVTARVLNETAEVYDDLCNRQASWKSYEDRRIRVNFGPVGAAKVLFALRPETFPPWDQPILDELEYDGSADSYRRYLDWVRERIEQVTEEALGFGISSDDLPRVLGRPSSSLPKIIDEYNWVTITNECPPPTVEQLEQWLKWARGRRRQGKARS